MQSEFFPARHRALARVVLLACLACGGVSAQAQATASGQAIRYDIAAGTLDNVLNNFASTAGIALAIDGSLTAGKRSAGLSGTFSVDQGLTSILAGSGLATTIQPDGGYTLVERPGGSAETVLAPVRVTDTADGENPLGPVAGFAARRSVTATKTDTPLIETPQSISVVSAEQIRAQGAQSIEQSLNYTVGTVVGSNGPSTEHDYIFARGFTARQFLDGTSLYASYVSGAQLRIEPFGLERVEVLRGPSSALYGQVEPGGLVNLVSKRPGATPLRQIGVQIGNFDRRQLRFDVGDALDADRRINFRLTGLYRDSDTQSDHMENDRQFIAPSLSWEIAESTTLTLLAHYQNDEGGGRAQPLPPEGTLLPNPNGDVPLDRFLGEPGFDGMEREQYSIGYAFEHRFNEVVSFRQNARHSEARMDERFSLVDYYGPTWTGDLRTIERSAWDNRNELALTSIDNQLEAAFDTGAFTHGLLLGFDYKRIRDQWDFFSADEGMLDVFEPVYGQPLGEFVRGVDERTTRRQSGVYLQDQIHWRQWVATLGLRNDRARGSTSDRLYGFTTKLDDRKTTGRAGLTYLFEKGLAAYASTSTSFDPVSGADAQGRAFDPTTGKQTEVGLKFQPTEDFGLITFSLFDLEQRNVLTPDPNPPETNPFAQIQTGEIEVKGAELEANLHLSEALSMLASYSWLDSEITRSNSGDLGRDKPYTPKRQASMWLDYRFADGVLNGVELGAGVRYRSAVWGYGYEFHIPSYTLGDIAIRYRLNESAMLALNIRNVSDKEYVTNCSYADGCIYGDRRTALLSLDYDF